MRLLRATLAVLLAAAGAVAFLAQSASAAAPNWTYNYYVDTLNYQHWYDLGYAQGQADQARAGTQNRLVILAFGSPALSGGVYGADPPGSLSFASRETLRDVPVNFARGYYIGTGADTASTITLALGATNYGSQVATNATQQGRAWSNFVQTAKVDTQGYSSQVTVTGAYDIEIGWNTPAASLALLDGYASINVGNPAYDFGDAGGCPTTTRDNCVTGGYTWPIEDVWQKAYGRAFMYPVPEIYGSSGTNAKQWANLSRYGYNQHGYSISFPGTLSQYQACLDVSDPCTPQSPGATKNTPDTAWTQLYNELQAVTTTAMTPRWSNNIRWGSVA